ncbi:MAG: membrane dipeptidase [Prevotella sp.]|nr:membrane dipeptidase [Prevotella sp.]
MKYDLQSELDSIYSLFPEGKCRPVIGITANFNDGDTTLNKPYYAQMVAAGGVPMLIPPVADRDVLISTLDRIDGLLLSGGADINPLWAGEEPSPNLHHINAERDLPELLLTQLAYNRQIPILGICRGIQTLAVALGGKVIQDLEERGKATGRRTEFGNERREERLRVGERSSGMREYFNPQTSILGKADTSTLKLQPSTFIKHSQDAARSEKTHSVNVEKDSLLSYIYNKVEKLYVNSFHHQAVRSTGDRFRVTATAPDGIIEAMESTEYKSILGVQWHPECLGEDGLPLFQWLVNEADEFRAAKKIHQRVLTLDTHCDTPMFFPKGIHFEQRDPKILVDLHKMTDGQQDATIMAAYLPQSFNPQPSTLNLTPSGYADSIFDQIESIVASQADYLALARTPDDLYRNKREGRKSIMLAIENGLALEGDIRNLQHFADRGIVYMTLCHNGDNDICDSARGSNTHNGVSDFGEQVIREMNRLGILVDLSHAAEKSFYDALDISTKPIVCSHSSSRALCDHPRNLTDDQMRALAAKGGVAHTTLYPGFLRKDGEACILDAIAHLEHAIDIMGIDHVGLGTDFDGDGGIRGLADASELINFTRALLRRRYSETDIEKIWGGNWLRVMRNA